MATRPIMASLPSNFMRQPPEVRNAILETVGDSGEPMVVEPTTWILTPVRTAKTFGRSTLLIIQQDGRITDLSAVSAHADSVQLFEEACLQCAATLVLLKTGPMRFQTSTQAQVSIDLLKRVTSITPGLQLRGVPTGGKSLQELVDFIGESCPSVHQIRLHVNLDMATLMLERWITSTSPAIFNNKGVIDHFEKVTNLYGIREVVIIDSSSDDDVSEGERKRRRMMKQKS
jgi:hypothetical protein